MFTPLRTATDLSAARPVGRSGSKATVLTAVSLAAVTLTAVGLAACSSANHAAVPVASASASASAVQADFVNVVNQVRPSVVEITTSAGLGSGVVFDDKGDIVTNAHVVGTAQQFQVTFFDGQTVAATLVGTYPPDDLAVIKVNRAKGVNKLVLDDSSKLQVGDIVMAIGNPLGLASSVTEGIVSFAGRTVSEGNGVVLPDTIQTSAAINPGNSGGALVDLQGRLVGIPTLAAVDPELGGSAAGGIGFAIPSNTVRLVANQLVSQGKVVDSGRAALGMSGATAVDLMGNPVGVIVADVQAGGTAVKAGIKPGDVITKINGTATPALSVLQDVLAGLKPGEKVTVTLLRADGTTHDITVTLGNLGS
jgi:putative serine protease PepD